MKLSGLSFDAIPPIDVPFRFFITAPLIAILVSGLIFFTEPTQLISRWNNSTIAITHGFTLGFMLLVMIGALFQIFPVILGVKINRVEVISKWIHLLLVIGVTSLVLGLLDNQTKLLFIASGSLSLGLVILVVCLIRCFSQMANSASSLSIRLAIIALLITVILGFLFIIARLNPEFFLSFRLWTNIHLSWGILGWVLLLVMGVSFKIIPMFYVTNEFPQWLTKYLPLALFSQLILISFFQGLSIDTSLLSISLVLTSCIHPLYTLYLIQCRKRKTQDVTLWFWNCSQICFLIGAIIFLLLFFVTPSYQNVFEIIFGVMIIFGYVMCLMIGMLLKIVPFLVWLNLQQAWIKQPSKKMPLSNMYQVISNATAKKQFYLFIMMLLMILTYWLVEPSISLIKLVSILMMLTFSHLLVVLFKAKQLYNRLALELV